MLKFEPPNSRRHYITSPSREARATSSAASLFSITCTTRGGVHPSNHPAMVDIDLLVQQLRAKGHDVRGVHQVPDNAGDYEFVIDGNLLTLVQARDLLERESK